MLLKTLPFRPLLKLWTALRDLGGKRWFC